LPNITQLELSTIVSTFGQLNSAVQNIKGIESVWLYPNGGTASSPANIAVNSRYVMNHPFPGFHVKCVLQLLYNSNWGNPSFTYTSVGVGATANVLGNNIIVQTGGSYLISTSANGGDPFGISTNVAGPLPCRVYCEKGGSLP